MSFHDQHATEGSGLLAGGRVHPDVTRQISAQRGRGAPLPPAVREQMSSALGDSFADVRVHHDGLSTALARSVQARAFTTGSDVFFARGEYQPQSPGGRELLAHELTHVVQGQRGTAGVADGHVSSPGDASEQEAARVGKAVADAPGGAAAASSGPAAAPAAVARDVGHEHDEGCAH